MGAAGRGHHRSDGVASTSRSGCGCGASYRRPCSGGDCLTRRDGCGDGRSDSRYGSGGDDGTKRDGHGGRRWLFSSAAAFAVATARYRQHGFRCNRCFERVVAIEVTWWRRFG